MMTEAVVTSPSPSANANTRPLPTVTSVLSNPVTSPEKSMPMVNAPVWVPVGQMVMVTVGRVWSWSFFARPAVTVIVNVSATALLPSSAWIVTVWSPATASPATVPCT